MHKAGFPMNIRTIRRSLLSAALLVASAIPFQASAGQQTSNLSVTSSIVNTCTISTAPVAFVAYDPVVANASTPLPGTGTITTTCTTGAAPVITLGQGSNAGGGSTDAAPVRQMANGASKMAYGLFQDSGHSIVWGNTPGTAPASIAGTGVAQNATVYGQIPAGQNLPSGSYADTVVATVTF
jgi:spore coat protein U-like protein